MLTEDDNHLLTRVAGDAPMGRLMRRHWIAICMSEELAERDGTPLRVQVLGEKLVAFRDTAGRIGLLGEHCPHRRVSLALGRNEENGLRCLFHGWKMDVEGTVVDMPSERFAAAGDRRRHLSYPAQESGGLVWAYLGDRATMPEFSPPPWARNSVRKVSIAKAHVNVNWAQIIEGGLDSSHSHILHSTTLRAGTVARASVDAKLGQTRPSNDRAPRLQVQITDYGLRSAAIRTPIENAATHDYLRITEYIAPLILIIPPNAVSCPAVTVTPMDDQNSMMYMLDFSESDAIDQEAYRAFIGWRVGIELDANYRKTRTMDNRFLQDRQAMKLGSFSGISGLGNEDLAMFESMGSIADRGRESLGASDISVAQFRRVMSDAARAERDGAPSAFATPAPLTHLQSFEGVVAKTVDWRTLASGAPDKSTLDLRREAGE